LKIEEEAEILREQADQVEETIVELTEAEEVIASRGR